MYLSTTVYSFCTTHVFSINNILYHLCIQQQQYRYSISFMYSATTIYSFYITNVFGNNNISLFLYFPCVQLQQYSISSMYSVTTLYSLFLYSIPPMFSATTIFSITNAFNNNDWFFLYHTGLQQRLCVISCMCKVYTDVDCPPVHGDKSQVKL